ncbi:6-phospho-beta-glucosidase [Streptomyces candidus]|uniref:6-phospho-beta-glucosidase n=1 Tax=Streptomyces candidus TaxID=67283 RepID=A0A7X0LSL1_9ACTN|nr:6-phospho-beta-glucosidase [Streptomyces candidus]MBB6438076.1 6-phospho-beta-glucosidase [Streptomyces candidus]GHH39388.1 6-phospho-beta-glucosidase [Streptomyces candidus]
MHLTILGGGGFRVPLVYGALLRDRGEGRVTRVTLHDLDAARLDAIARVLCDQAVAARAEGAPEAPEVRVTTDLDDALRGADFVFSAIRVGGLAGRAADERVALDEGVLGQETVGAGGIAYGLRTVPVAVDIARRVARLAPDAWVINFTNPAGLVTEAMSRHLGSRVIGICDSPVGLARRVARTLGVPDPAAARADYAGLNHLGWLRGLYVDDRDVLPELFVDQARLTSFEEGRLFGADWLRALGSVPNEYLHYYYFNREAVAAYRQARQTRGAFLRDQQARFYEELSAGPHRAPSGAAWEAWDRTRAEREATYMAENREAAGAGERAADDLESGGYEYVALALMRAVARDERTTLILNVRNAMPDRPGGRVLDVLDEAAVVEVPCTVDAAGARPVAVSQLAGHEAGLVAAVKAVERCVLDAAESGSARDAVKAFALHPLVDSVQVARRLLTGYRDAHPGLGYLRER